MSSAARPECSETRVFENQSVVRLRTVSRSWYRKTETPEKVCVKSKGELIREDVSK